MAKYNKAKKKLIYRDWDEFYSIQEARSGKQKPFDPKDKPHIAHDLKRFMRLVGRKKKVLDAGCRDGWAMSFLKKRGYESVYGFDVVKKNVDFCQSQGLTVEIADAENMQNYEADTFDAVFCRHVLEHVMNPQAALKEFARVLKPGGVFYCVVPFERKGTIPRVKYGHSYIFNDISELIGMCKGKFRKISVIKSEKTRSTESGTYVGRKP